GATVNYTLTLDFTDSENLGKMHNWGVLFKVFLGRDGEAYVYNQQQLTIDDFEDLGDAVFQFATDVFFATECTKGATATFGATYVATEEATEDLQWITNHSFILDLEDPFATITIVDLDITTGVATISLIASDTKCIDDVEIDFYVEKGKDDWELDVDWGDEEFVLGDSDHAVSGEATYAKDSSADGETWIATFTMTLSEYGIDGATFTLHALVNDCCDYGVGHEFEEELSYFVDNVFLSEDIENEQYENHRVFVDFEGAIQDEDGRFWLPVPALNEGDPAYATLTIKLWDRAIDGASMTDFQQATVATYTSVTASKEGTESIVCTGYDVKDEWHVQVLMYASTEITTDATCATLTIEASDTEGNTYVYEFGYCMDTKPPTLTYVQGYTDGTATGNDDFVDFVFDEDVDPDYDGFAATLTIRNGGSATIKVYSQDEIEQLDMTDKTGFRIDTKGFTLPTGGTVELEVKARDVHGNIAVSKFSGGIAENASVR
ncbi:MAG TPA: hypothetical protein PLF96_14035, partial [Thermotogota bacterium]|nr:hypothetical protein [Thermotogota bacterium]